MSELYETKTTYREIAKDWKDAAIEFSQTWQFWWIYTLMCVLTVAIHLTLIESKPLIPSEFIAAFAVYAAYKTHKRWGVYNA